MSQRTSVSFDLETMRENGLFFSNALLKMPKPTDEEWECALSVLGEQAPLFYAVRMGPKKKRMAARNELLLKNKGLIGYVIYSKGWRNTIFQDYDRSIDIEDLWTIGEFGLIRAIEGFDLTRGYRFTTYAVKILQRNFERNVSIYVDGVRMPVYLLLRIRRYRLTKSAFFRVNGRWPTDDELRESLGLSQKVFEKLDRAVQTFSPNRRFEYRRIRLDEDGGALEILDLVRKSHDSPVDSRTDDRRERDHGIDMKNVLKVFENSSIPDREKKIIRLRYGIGGCEECTLEAIAAELGVSRERVRQLETKALKNLRRYFEIYFGARDLNGLTSQ